MINLRKGESDIKGHRAEFSNGLAVLGIPLIWGRNEPQLSPVFFVFCILYSVFSILYCRPLTVAVTMINLSISIESLHWPSFHFWGTSGEPTQAIWQNCKLQKSESVLTNRKMSFTGHCNNCWLLQIQSDYKNPQTENGWTWWSCLHPTVCD